MSLVVINGFHPLFSHFLTKKSCLWKIKLIYLSLCYYVPTNGHLKTYLLLRVTPLFLPDALVQAFRTDILIGRVLPPTYVLHTYLAVERQFLCPNDTTASAVSAAIKGSYSRKETGQITLKDESNNCYWISSVWSSAAGGTNAAGWNQCHRDSARSKCGGGKNADVREQGARLRHDFRKRRTTNLHIQV